MPAVPMLADSAARARAAMLEQQRLAEEAANAPVEAMTAFLVYITPEGEVAMNTNIDIPITVEREPHPDEVRGACNTVAEDITTREIVTLTVQNTVNNVMINLQRMMLGQMEQAENQQIQQQLAAPGTPAAFRRPPGK